MTPYKEPQDKTPPHFPSTQPSTLSHPQSIMPSPPIPTYKRRKEEIKDILDEQQVSTCNEGYQIIKDSMSIRKDDQIQIAHESQKKYSNNSTLNSTISIASSLYWR